MAFSFLPLQSAYSFWICSERLPLYLTPSRSRGGGGGGGDQQAEPPPVGDEEQPPGKQFRQPVQVEMCPSVCREVERKCPFFILGHEDDKAAGNPSFICKGRNTGAEARNGVVRMKNQKGAHLRLDWHNG